MAHRRNKAPLSLPSASTAAEDTDDQTISIPLGKPKNDWLPLSSYRDQMDERYLAQLLTDTHGSRLEACRISGLSRTRLFAMLDKHGLSHTSRPPATATS